MKQNPDYSRAYLILGGSGWKLKDYYINNNLKDHIKNYKPKKIIICSTDSFLEIVNKRKI